MREIKRKVDLLKKYDTNFVAFGSKEHQYELNPVLSEDEINNFEKKEKVNLPDSYKEFLMNIGNGGAGPSYGIYSLEKARNGAGWHPPLEDLNNNNEYPGELLISHNGCGLFNWLKVSGASSGEIWYDGTTNDSGTHKVSSNFIKWYNKWLDSIFLETGFIAYLGNEAFEKGQQGLYEESFELFKIAVNIKYDDNIKMRDDVRSEYLKMFCNVLYFLQNDNTGLPVDKELNNFFLEKCMKYGKENPAIYFNAACVYNEMKEFGEVVNCIKLAKEYYDGYDMMMGAIASEGVFAEFRKDKRYSDLV